MDATVLAPDAPLPTDVPTLQAMVRELLTELAKLRAENAECPVGDMVRERAAERAPSRLAVDLDVEGAHLGREGDAAARELRRANRAGALHLFDEREIGRKSLFACRPPLPRGGAMVRERRSLDD